MTFRKTFVQSAGSTLGHAAGVVCLVAAVIGLEALADWAQSVWARKIPCHPEDVTRKLIKLEHWG